MASSELREIRVIDVQPNVRDGLQIDILVSDFVLLVEDQVPPRVHEGPIAQAVTAVDVRREQPDSIEEGVEHGRTFGEAEIILGPVERRNHTCTALTKIEPA